LVKFGYLNKYQFVYNLLENMRLKNNNKEYNFGFVIIASILKKLHLDKVGSFFFSKKLSQKWDFSLNFKLRVFLNLLSIQEDLSNNISTGKVHSTSVSLEKILNFRAPGVHFWEISDKM